MKNPASFHGVLPLQLGHQLEDLFYPEQTLKPPNFKIPAKIQSLLLPRPQGGLQPAASYSTLGAGGGRKFYLERTWDPGGVAKLRGLRPLNSATQPQSSRSRSAPPRPQGALR